MGRVRLSPSLKIHMRMGMAEPHVFHGRFARARQSQSFRETWSHSDIRTPKSCRPVLGAGSTDSGVLVTGGAAGERGDGGTAWHVPSRGTEPRPQPRLAGADGQHISEQAWHVGAGSGGAATAPEPPPPCRAPRPREAVV